MPRSKPQEFSTKRLSSKLSHASFKRENYQRFLELSQASREQGRMARELASLAGWVPEKVPSALLQQMKAAAKRASKPLRRKSKSTRHAR